MVSAIDQKGVVPVGVNPPINHSLKLGKVEHQTDFVQSIVTQKYFGSISVTVWECTLAIVV